MGRTCPGHIRCCRGCRQFDQSRGSLDVLPEVVDATGGKAQVFVDGGFCRGTDVVKAIAMGADAVGIGRLYCYAMAAAGAPDIVRMLDLLETEITNALGLPGVPGLEALSAAHVCAGSPVVSDLGVLGAFPLVGAGSLGD